MEEFYRGFAQGARDLAENADPFTKRRLLVVLATHWELSWSRPAKNHDSALPQPEAVPEVR